MQSTRDGESSTQVLNTQYSSGGRYYGGENTRPGDEAMANLVTMTP